MPLPRRALAGLAAGAALLASSPLLGGSLVTAAPATAGQQDRSTTPIVAGHRGASGYRPEHTLAAYSLAIAMGADYIEPDLVSTRDGVLVARHENEIGGTTDVAAHPEFAGRRTSKTVDGVSLTGWFTENFTLAELRTLRAKERIPATRQENTVYDGRFLIPTLDEVIDLARAQSKVTGRTIGILPETKHPTYFDGIGLSLEEPLLAALDRGGYRKQSDPVIVQSFEVSNLRELSTRTDVRLVQLFGGNPSSGPKAQPYDAVVSGSGLTYDAMSTPRGLTEIATYADAIGPDKGRVIPVVDGRLGTPTSLVTDAHARGLTVVPYTFRAENQFLPASLRTGTNPNDFGNVLGEITAFLDAGVDGVFADQPDLAVLARGR